MTNTDYGAQQRQRYLTPSVTIKFEPRDLWIGVFWMHSKSVESAYQNLTVYVCILPILPIRFEWAWGVVMTERAAVAQGGEG